MIAGWTITPEAYLAFAGILLAAGLLVILGRWGRPDRFVSRSAFASFIADFGPIALCFALVVVCAMLVWCAYSLRLHAGHLERSILPGFFASLVEDIVFFSAIGIVIFVIQRREFERNRNLDDRIDTLFNAKRLTAEELSDLKRQMRRLGCDLRHNVSSIDIREHDPGSQCLRLDVTRQWSVGNYFSDEIVEYDWRLKLRPDDIPGISPLMEIFPSQMRTRKLDAKGRLTSATQAIELHGPVALVDATTYEHPSRIERIEPGTQREFQCRYRAWQRLMKAGTTDRDYWEFEAEKHWDSCVIKVVNSLQKRVRIHIRAKETRVFDLASGAQQTEPFEINDLVHGSQVFIEFEILH